MNYKDEIEHLKNLTLSEKNDLAVPGTAFLDLSDNPELYQYSTLLKEQLFFWQLLDTSIKQYYGNTVKIVDLLLHEIKDSHFVHGAGGLSNGKMVVLYFYNDIQIGMAFTAALGGHTDFFRLTLFVDKDNKLSGKTILSTAYTETVN